MAGLVTDGSVRDSESLKEYNFPVYAHSYTSKQGPGIMLPYHVNQPINCGGVLVRPGDYIIGDNDGVVVLPEKIAVESIKIMEEREEIEKLVKDKLTKSPGSPENITLLMILRINYMKNSKKTQNNLCWSNKYGY